MALNFQQIDSSSHVGFKSSFVPPSFYLPSQINLFLKFVKTEGDQVWITKPIRSGEGRGIQLYASSHEFLSTEYPSISIDEISHGHVNHETVKTIKKKMVVSKYIKNPLLINGKKFDMRLYVLVVGARSQNEQDRAYLYQDGIVRLASEDYNESTETLHNHFIHLTNNTINDKKNKIQHETIVEKYGFFCNMNLDELQNYFKTQNMEWKPLWNRLKRLVRESLNFTIFCKEHQDGNFQQTRHRCFELYGFDILVDCHLNPYLLEVNSMPDLSGVSQSSHLVLKKDFCVKSNMLVNAMNLVGIPILTHDTTELDCETRPTFCENALLDQFTKL